MPVKIVIGVIGVPVYCGPVTTQVIVLNGGSSSGKSGIARCLQAVLPDPWLAFGVDEAWPPRTSGTVAGGRLLRRVVSAS
jgi:chloramphenicol 3-O phosphotransferase